MGININSREGIPPLDEVGILGEALYGPSGVFPNNLPKV
jgi:hypothetical protein